jgi:hypothetical protein
MGAKEDDDRQFKRLRKGPVTRNKQANTKAKTSTDSNKKNGVASVPCSVCLAEPTDVSEINCCNHKFCFECIYQWSRVTNTCPLCKTRFTKIQRFNAKQQTNLVVVPNKNQVPEYTPEELDSLAIGHATEDGLTLDDDLAGFVVDDDTLDYENSDVEGHDVIELDDTDDYSDTSDASDDEDMDAEEVDSDGDDYDYEEEEEEEDEEDEEDDDDDDEYRKFGENYYIEDEAEEATFDEILEEQETDSDPCDLVEYYEQEWERKHGKPISEDYWIDSSGVDESSDDAKHKNNLRKKRERDSADDGKLPGQEENPQGSSVEQTMEAEVRLDDGDEQGKWKRLRKKADSVELEIVIPELDGANGPSAEPSAQLGSTTNQPDASNGNDSVNQSDTNNGNESVSVTTTTTTTADSAAVVENAISTQSVETLVESDQTDAATPPPPPPPPPSLPVPPPAAPTIHHHVIVAPPKDRIIRRWLRKCVREETLKRSRMRR